MNSRSSSGFVPFTSAGGRSIRQAVALFRRHDSRPRFGEKRIVPSLSAALLLAIYGGCNSGGSSFGTGGSTGSGTGNGSGTGSGGSAVSGSGGTTGPGTGGTSGGTGGGVAPGSGGSSTGSGGGTGTGGTSTGGRAATGGSVGSGGMVTTGTGGAVGAGGAAAGTGGAVVLPACPKPAGQICHEFFANDNSANHRVTYVNEFTSTAPGGVVWTATVPDLPADAGLNHSPRTIQIVDNAAAKSGKALLVSIDQGYAELDLVDGKQLAVVTNFRGISGAVRIPEDGTTAIARGTDNVIIILGAAPNTGTTVRMFPIPPGADLRAINRNPTTKHFWLTHTEIVYEVTDTGQIVWQANMPVGSKGYAVFWRDGGGAYATSGDPSTVVEIDANKTIVNTVGGKTLFPTFLDFFSGFVRLPNGNFVVANWLGHLASATGEFATHQVIEFTPANKVVWNWGSATLSRQITNVYVVR